MTMRAFLHLMVQAHELRLHENKRRANNNNDEKDKRCVRGRVIGSGSLDASGKGELDDAQDDDVVNKGEVDQGWPPRKLWKRIESALSKEKLSFFTDPNNKETERLVHLSKHLLQEVDGG